MVLYTHLGNLREHIEFYVVLKWHFRITEYVRTHTLIDEEMQVSQQTELRKRFRVREL
jgi:hypothetical protein